MNKKKRIMSINMNDFGGKNEHLMNHRYFNNRDRKYQIDWKYWAKQVKKDETWNSLKEYILDKQPDLLVIEEMLISCYESIRNGSYYVLAGGEADWNRYLNRIEEKNWYVDFSDIQMICYKLTESGIWSHEHINPLYLEVEFPTYIEDDPKRQALRYATEALGDYLCHKSKEKEFCPDLILKYARKYAEVCRGKSLSEKTLEEAKKPEDIMM